MKKLLISLLLILGLEPCYAHCNLRELGEICVLPAHLRPSGAASSLVYCGNLPLYVTKAQYKLVADYQRASVELALKVNGEYLVSPCIAANPG